MSAVIQIYADSRYPIDRKKIRRRVESVLNSRHVIGRVQIEISIVGDRKMKFLNNKFRKIDRATNVLAFPLEEKISPEGILYLGDIVISWPQARDYAVRANQLISDVVADLTEHGLLHLLGIHHPE